MIKTFVLVRVLEEKIDDLVEAARLMKKKYCFFFVFLKGKKVRWKRLALGKKLILLHVYNQFPAATLEW